MTGLNEMPEILTPLLLKSYILLLFGNLFLVSRLKHTFKIGLTTRTQEI